MIPLSSHYFISCKYSCARSASRGLHVWKPYAQWDKLAVRGTIMRWNKVYRSAFRAVANGFWVQAGKCWRFCFKSQMQGDKNLLPASASTPKLSLLLIIYICFYVNLDSQSRLCAEVNWTLWKIFL